jgi:PTS system N-acetylglucosamine-specific IIC component
MFALPGAALAFIHTAKPEKKKMVASIFIGSAIASILTGITEPLEFSFMFVAPLLYLVHALLTGVSMAVMYVLDVRLGFSFSAGLIDYLTNLKISTNAWILFPVGLAFFVLYYVLFRFVIVKFNLKTPGREDDTDDEIIDLGKGATTVSASSRAAKILENIGGPANIRSIDACITRLRLNVNDDKAVKDSALKQLGASGVMRLGQGAVQIVFGPQSEQIKDDIKKLM